MFQFAVPLFNLNKVSIEFSQLSLKGSQLCFMFTFIVGSLSFELDSLFPEFLKSILSFILSEFLRFICSSDGIIQVDDLHFQTLDSPLRICQFLLQNVVGCQSIV